MYNIFLFKQKTAYERRISDWSSDVCSSDLPDLTLSRPAEMSIASGLNAISHAMEGLYAFDGNPIVSLMAEESIRALARSLPLIKADPTDAKAREIGRASCRERACQYV